ncbi:MAG: DUF2304 domain-containing protein [Phycisphaerales bacterium]|nr:DUF2304 domain-containing protein [Phycisphaerales bacterium]
MNIHLNSFQIILLGVSCLLFVGCIAAMARGWVTFREGFVGLIICVATAVVTIWPDLTARVADKLGIGRGADLVFYCAVIVMMIGFWMTYMRLRHLRRELTLLVRHTAILEAHQDPSSEPERNTLNPQA